MEGPPTDKKPRFRAIQSRLKSYLRRSPSRSTPQSHRPAAAEKPGTPSVSASAPQPAAPDSGSGQALSPPALQSPWEKAFVLLPAEDREVLQAKLGLAPDYQAVLSSLLDATKVRHELCLKQQWRVNVDGESVALHEVTGRLIHWVDKFKAIGDVICQYDPVHLALPWAGIRFLLQLSVENFEKLASLLVALEKITNIIGRCAVYEELRFENRGAVNTERFEKALVDLYVTLLRFLVTASNYLSHSTVARTLSGATGASVFSLSEIQDSERTVHTEWEIIVAQMNNESHQQLLALLQDLSPGISVIGKEVKAIRDHSEKAAACEEQQRVTEALQWISKVTFVEHHVRASEGRVENTGEWLLQHDIFKSWIESTASATLWLHGIPGCGKTKLASVVIDHLKERTNSVVYFYCNRDESDRNNQSDLIRTLVRQLARSRDRYPQLVVDEYERRKRDGMVEGLLTLSDSTNMLHDLIASDVVIVIDALDECDKISRSGILNSLSTLTSNCRLKVFITSRDEQDIVRKMADTPNLYISASDNAGDIERFVRMETDRCVREGLLLDGEAEKAFCDMICNVLIGKANGMFLWCDLQIKRLCELEYQSDIEKELGKLPETLDKTYERIYENIMAQKATAPLLASAIFFWMVCNYRPLTVSEITAALLFHIPSLRRSDLEKEENLLRVCGNLVVIDQQLGVVRTAHLSVTEWLERRPSAEKLAHTMASNVCLRTLNSAVQVKVRGDWGSPDVVKNVDDFQEYTISFWMKHLQMAGDGPERSLFERVMGTYYSPGQAFLWWFSELTHRHSGKPTEMPEIALRQTEERTCGAVQSYEVLPGGYINPLAAALLWGLGTIADRIYDAPYDPQYRNHFGETLLYIACRCYHLGAFREKACNCVYAASKVIDAVGFEQGGYCSYPLIVASMSNNGKLVSFLLDRGHPPDEKGGEWASALQRAAFIGDLDMARTLVEHGANVNKISGYYGTALQAAAEADQADIIRYLLEEGADPNLLCGRWGSALQAALGHGAQKAAWALLAGGADVNLRGANDYWGYPLQAAAHCPKEDTALFDRLLELGAEVEVYPPCGLWGSALAAATNRFRAAAGQGTPVFTRLLEKGASPLIVQPDGFYGTPAAAACYNMTLEELLQIVTISQECLELPGGYYGCALSAALGSSWCTWSEAAVAYFHSLGSSINIVGGQYHTPLQTAAAVGDAPAVRKLLDLGAHPNLFGGAFGSALQAAISAGHDDIAAVLREGGATTSPSFDLAGELAPSRFDASRMGPGITVSEDGLQIEYDSYGSDFYPGMILANHPTPARDKFYYFEVEILERTERGAVLPRVGVGVCVPGGNLSTRPGIHTHTESWAYHSEDGGAWAMHWQEIRRLQAAAYTYGDVVGVGILPRERCVFFTKNGFSTEMKVRVNFGQIPFVYDVSKREDDCKAGLEDPHNKGTFKDNPLSMPWKWG